MRLGKQGKNLYNKNLQYIGNRKRVISNRIKRDVAQVFDSRVANYCCLHRVMMHKLP